MQAGRKLTLYDYRGLGTELTLLHEHFFDMAARDGHEFGWTGSMEKLRAFLRNL